MTNLQELITKLEKATEPDRELDAIIAIASGIKHRSRHTTSGINKGREWLVDSHAGVETWKHHPPAYTSSLDAALTLVPEGAVWSVQTDYELPGRAHINHLIPIADERLRPPSNFNVDGATPAIALCIAALKARQ